MKTCDTCTHYKPRFIPCYGCHNNDGWEPKPQTNADRIRAMTDEELAKMISGFESFALTCGGAWPPDKWLDWLRQEAE